MPLSVILKRCHNVTPSDSVTHIPVSSVPLEEVNTSLVSDLCCSNKGVAFIADKGRNQIYRIDIDRGNCTTFGKEIIGEYCYCDNKYSNDTIM